MAWKFTTRRALGLNAVCAVLMWLGVTWIRLDRLANQYRQEAGEHALTAIRLLLKARELDLQFHQSGYRDFDLEEQRDALQRASDEQSRLAEACDKKAKEYRTAAYRLSGLILCDPGEISAIDYL